MKKTIIAIIMAVGACAPAPAQALRLGDLLGGGGSGSGLDYGRVLHAAGTAGQALKDYTPEQENAIGHRVMADLLGAAPLARNPALQRYVNQVGRWVALQSDKPDLNWRFGVTDDLHVNSFAAPGGYILITKGLYDRLHSEAELAAVLAHEIAHVVKGHQIRAMKSAKGGEFLATTAKMVAESRGGDQARYTANAFSGGTEIFVRGMDKDDEYEADTYGMVLTARAGYSPFALPAVLTMIGNISPKDNAVGLLFSTHPSPRDRLDHIEASIGDKLDAFAQGTENTPAFRRLHGNGQR